MCSPGFSDIPCVAGSQASVPGSRYSLDPSRTAKLNSGLDAVASSIGLAGGCGGRGERIAVGRAGAGVAAGGEGGDVGGDVAEAEAEAAFRAAEFEFGAVPTLAPPEAYC